MADLIKTPLKQNLEKSSRPVLIPHTLLAHLPEGQYHTPSKCTTPQLTLAQMMQR